MTKCSGRVALQKNEIELFVFLKKNKSPKLWQWLWLPTRSLLIQNILDNWCNVFDEREIQWHIFYCLLNELLGKNTSISHLLIYFRPLCDNFFRYLSIFMLKKLINSILSKHSRFYWWQPLLHSRLNSWPSLLQLISVFCFLANFY